VPPITIEFASKAALMAADGGRPGVVITTIKRYRAIVAPVASRPFTKDSFASWLNCCEPITAWDCACQLFNFTLEGLKKMLEDLAVVPVLGYLMQYPI
jgi:hypothetical protein